MDKREREIEARKKKNGAIKLVIPKGGDTKALCINANTSNQLNTSTTLESNTND